MLLLKVAHEAQILDPVRVGTMLAEQFLRLTSPAAFNPAISLRLLIG